MKLEYELETLKKIRLPTHNRTTDHFGILRKWGRHDWHPGCGYSPVHAGVDFSERDDEKIYMAIDGKIWGEIINGSVGSYCMIIPENSFNVALYFFHCEPTETEWRQAYSGEHITNHAGYGIGAPHLHFELCVTESVGRILKEKNILRPIHRLENYVIEKARNAHINSIDAAKAVDNQIKTWGITEIGENYFVRDSLPEYKKSRYSEIGRGMTYVIDPLHIIQSQGEL